MIALRRLPVLLPLLLIVGCMRGAYRAADLPVSYAAKPTVNVQELDLSGLAQTGTEAGALQKGDLIGIQIQTGLEQETKPMPVRIADDGTTEVPLVGRVRLAGLREDQAGEAIRRASIERKIYRNPNVTLTVRDRRKNKIVMMGAVEEPGAIELETQRSDLISALGAAGGLKDEADTVVTIKRPGNGGEVKIDLERKDQYTPQQLRLPDGAIVQIPEREERAIFVNGLVNSGNRFVIKPGVEVRMLDALAMAGGRKMEIADSVSIVRNIPGQPDPVLIKLSVSDAKTSQVENILLADGDVITVEETPATFALSLAQTFFRFSSAVF